MAKFKIVESAAGFDAVQVTVNGPWWHSVQHGYWSTYEACKEFIESNWGKDVQYVVNIWQELHITDC